jgi:hypothetical protein
MKVASTTAKTLKKVQRLRACGFLIKDLDYQGVDLLLSPVTVTNVEVITNKSQIQMPQLIHRIERALP